MKINTILSERAIIQEQIPTDITYPGTGTTAPLKGQVATTPNGFMAGLAQGLGADGVANDIKANAQAAGGIRSKRSATSTGADAAAKAQQSQVQAVKRTGGKVAGQLSQTPRAIRKRAATAAKKDGASTFGAGGASAFGNMASQLAARPTTSSTGGTTTGVAGVGNGVVRHTANPNNPNMQPTTAATTSTPAPQTANPFAGLGQPAGSFTGRQPKKTKAVAPVAESRVDFGFMLFNRMKSGK